MRGNAIWMLVATATVAGALATLPSPDTVSAGLVGFEGGSYRCYPASAVGGTLNLPIQLRGEDLAGPFNVTLKKAKSICLPARIDNAVNDTSPPGAILACFSTKDVVPEDFPKVVLNVTVQHVGNVTLKVKKSNQICLPIESLGGDPM
jgi:hypothetical protein